MYCSRNEEKENWIEDYVERATGGARQGGQEAEAAIRLEQEDTVMAENACLTTREVEKTFKEMMVATGVSLSDIASFNDGEDGELKNEEDTEQGKLSEDDERGWVTGTISNIVPQHMEEFQQNQMKLDKLTQPEWGDPADYLRDRDKEYSSSKLRVPVVVIP